MIYRDFQNIKLPALGVGTMRLPLVDKDTAHIDEKQVEEMFAYAMEHGANYFDTAWGYHMGKSELLTGKLLSAYPRESFFLASKFPGYELENMPKVKEIFPRQLEKCRVDYFDFYLFHNVCEMNINEYLDPQYEIFDYLVQQKREGRIKHLGFSIHGSEEVLRRFLDAYGSEMEFCQIQLNYIDHSFQDAAKKLAILQEHSIPVWVMEPLRGGSLASLAPEYMQRLEALRPGVSAAEWAFRFIQSIPTVAVTLSGMSSFEQLKDNIRIFSEEAPLSTQETETLFGIARDMLSKKILPCTACRYCVSHCPQKLDIPSLLALYNEHKFTGGGFLAPMQLGTMAKESLPSACVACRSCEAVCPQQLKISDAMADFSRALGL